MADFPSDKYTFDCKYVSFCIEFNTFIRLGIANSFLFQIFPCCYFYVMSQSTFPDQIKPRPLIACLNCAAWVVDVLFGVQCLILLNQPYLIQLWPFSLLMSTLSVLEPFSKQWTIYSIADDLKFLVTLIGELLRHNFRFAK